MHRVVKSNEEIRASSFNGLLSHVNEEPCCFITAYRKEYSHKQNAERNKELESEIRNSGLSFIKMQGRYPEIRDNLSENPEGECSFCVIDNKYSFRHFKSLCLEWCNKYDQDAVLITAAVVDKVENGRKLFVGVGQLYDKSENVIGETLTDVTLRDIEDYFSKIGGSRFTFTESSEYVETEGRDMRSYLGHVLSDQEFRKTYPNLV